METTSSIMDALQYYTVYHCILDTPLIKAEVDMKHRI